MSPGIAVTGYDEQQCWLCADRLMSWTGRLIARQMNDGGSASFALQQTIPSTGFVHDHGTTSAANR